MANIMILIQEEFVCTESLFVFGEEKSYNKQTLFKQKSCKDWFEHKIRITIPQRGSKEWQKPVLIVCWRMKYPLPLSQTMLCWWRVESDLYHQHARRRQASWPHVLPCKKRGKQWRIKGGLGHLQRTSGILNEAPTWGEVPRRSDEQVDIN